MNLLQLSQQLECTPDKLKKIFEKNGTRLFSDTFPISDELVSKLMNSKEFKNNVHTEKAKMTSESNVSNTTQDEEILHTLFGNQGNDFFEKCLKKHYHIIVDTCSIIEELDGFRKFYERYRPLMKKYNEKLIITFSVSVELGNIRDGKGNKPKSVRERAGKMFRFIGNEVKSGNIIVIGDRGQKWPNKQGKEDYFGDPDIIFQLQKWYTKGESSLLISQDGKVNSGVSYIHKVLACVKTNAVIEVRTLNKKGELLLFKNKK